jgi:hypothetical protein
MAGITGRPQRDAADLGAHSKLADERFSAGIAATIGEAAGVGKAVNPAAVTVAGIVDVAGLALAIAGAGNAVRPANSSATVGAAVQPGR